MVFLQALTFISSCFGAIALMMAIFLDLSAPQQAAMAGIAIGLAVIPYCMLRVSHIAQSLELQKQQTAAIEKLAAKQGQE
jgi:hypothetical protein